MRFQRLDLNLLVALDALLDEKSVSAAAERICLSQSATSSALGRLREYFGDELLVQKGRKMVLTTRGAELIDPVRDVLQQIRTTIARAPEFDPILSDRNVRIMASDYTMSVLLTKALQGLTVEAPNMTFHITAMADNLTQSLERGDIDLIITLDFAINADHPSEPLFEDNYVVIGWDQNPEITDSIDGEAYFKMGHVMTKIGSGRRTAFEEWFLRSQSLKRRIEVVAPSFLSGPPLVVGTNRIATVHHRLAKLAAQYLPLTILPTPFEIPPVRQSVQWHRGNNNDPCLSWIVARLKHYAAMDDEPVPVIASAKPRSKSASG